ncbi:hypothetical protein SNEBB_001201 [Seison nebaliae]|nr:hypothetical protein SNEBB_001201 [Seison nebaliae]
MNRKYKIFHQLTSNSFFKSVSRRMMTNGNEEILASIQKNVGIIQLNKEKSLNSLTYNMIKLLTKQLKEWENNDQVHLILVEGKGDKAFCAGGDIKMITENNGINGKKFFRAEYICDHLTSTINKPYIALLDGITMGGGVGISIHSSFRIATEKTRFAMPETGIGMIPDVGGSFFLPRLRGQLGYYLGLTGHHLVGKDNLYGGVATHFIEKEKLESFKLNLIDRSHDLNNEEKVQNILNELTTLNFQKKDFNKLSFANYLDMIDRCFHGNSMERINERLQNENCEWANKEIQRLNRMSPTSLKITLKQLNNGRFLTSLEDVLKMELRVASRLLRENSDFYEGVRALLVDKDQKPKWKPNKLSEVSDEFVDEFFRPMEDDLEL